jgi:dCMP deaminase
MMEEFIIAGGEMRCGTEHDDEHDARWWPVEAVVTRPTMTETFLSVARLFARRSPCLRRHHGAVLVQDNHLIATGYNGPTTGSLHCHSCPREDLGVPSGERYELCRAIHAEQNALLQAGLHGSTTQGAIMYVTGEPCLLCARMMVNAGIERVVYDIGDGGVCIEWPVRLVDRLEERAGL